MTSVSSKLSIGANCSINDLRRLVSPGRDIITLVNDPDVEQAEELAREALALDGIKASSRCRRRRRRRPRPRASDWMGGCSHARCPR